MTEVSAPTGDCPKCGMKNAWAPPPSDFLAFPSQQPQYRQRNIVRDGPPGKGYADSIWEEFLAWPCRWCGYETETPTLDGE